MTNFYSEPGMNPVLWGTVCDSCNRPLSGCLIKLIQCADENNPCCLVIGQTFSDSNGRYEFLLPHTCQGRYRIEVCDPGTCPVPARGQNSICYYN